MAQTAPSHKGPGHRRFEKSFTQQEPIAEAAIARAVEIMRSGRLHRYNVAEGEHSEAALLEQDFSAWQGSRYCLACTSGGYALHVALRSAGLKTWRSRARQCLYARPGAGRHP